jgi:hypothetical protein
VLSHSSVWNMSSWSVFCSGRYTRQPGDEPQEQVLGEWQRIFVLGVGKDGIVQWTARRVRSVRWPA